jgi:hypothetical protein
MAKHSFLIEFISGGIHNITPFHLNLHKFFSMEQQKKNTGIYWILFLLSTVALIVAIDKHFEYLTLILPFFCTFFVKALDIM